MPDITNEAQDTVSLAIAAAATWDETEVYTRPVKPSLYRACPGCGVSLPVSDWQPDGRYNASAECWQLYGELSAYTLAQGYDVFIHQLAVDAYGAQHSGASVRPIATAFALIGLYLAFERGYSGRQGQDAHRLLATQSKTWPRFEPSSRTGALTIVDVLKAPPGEDRDSTLRQWGQSVWDAWGNEHARVESLVAHRLG